MKIEFRILGPLELLVDGDARALGGPQQRAVLARLVLDAGRAVSSARLIDDVWNGSPPQSATKVLHKYVSHLRRVMPHGTLRTTAGGYALDVTGCLVDAVRFEGLVADGRYEDAMALWRGELLSDLDDLRFVESERTRLGELRLFALESRIEADLAAGRHGALVSELRELVEAYPLRERLTASLMRALYASGRQVEALRAFERHRRHLAEEIGVEPGAELRALEASILRDERALDLRPPADGHSRRPSLPATLSSFVGRFGELDAVERAVSENRLVTLTGPGGVGKTRLAIESAVRLEGRFPGGVWLVDLAGVADPHLVPMTIAGAVGADSRHAPDELTAVLAALANRPPTLVLLDNCEHLVEAAASVTIAMLGATGGVRVLATSRRPLGIDGEFVRPVQPLPESDAAALFVDRARLAAASSEATDATLHAFEICSRLDGLPLAIELAASQLRVMHPADIVARLGDQLTFRGPSVLAPVRQRSLGEMVQWSYGLLPAPVQRTFARLGVFASSLTLDAAEAVCTAPDVDRRETVEHITTLIDHSLLVRDHGPSTGTRYRLLETLRLFALERLVESGDVERACTAHVDYFHTLAAEGGAMVYGDRWRARLEEEEPNLHAALRWAAAHDPERGLRLAVALWPYWDALWRERYGVDYIEGLLTLDDPDITPETRAWAMTAAAAMNGNAGEARHTVWRATDAVSAFRSLDDARGLAYALAALGLGLGNQGHLAEAEAALDEGLAIARSLGDGVLIGRLLDRLGYVAGRHGDHARAARINRDEIAVMRQLGSRRGEATALRHLAASLQHLGEYDEATELCEQALAMWTELGDRAAIAHVQMTLADVARLRGDVDTALPIYDAALVEFAAIGDRRCTASTYAALARIASARGDLDSARGFYRDALRLRAELGDERGAASLVVEIAAIDAPSTRCQPDGNRALGG